MADTAIWRKRVDEWKPLLPSGFPSEEKLHDLIEEAPDLLPLSGDPTLTVLGREVRLGSGYADLIAVESDGGVVLLEIKLQKNAEAKRAVIAQILTYAANLKGQSAAEFESLMRSHLDKGDANLIVDLVRESDQTGVFDEQAFGAGLAEALASGGFRLVLVLDEAPSELVQLVGYLESISSDIVLDLITVSAYEAGDEQLLVPQRVDPDYRPEAPATPGGGSPTAKGPEEVDGSDAFKQAIDRAPAGDQPGLNHLLTWARALESEGLATLRTVFGKEREILLVWVRGQKAGLVTIWNDGGPYLSLWRSVFVRLAWDHIAPVEEVAGGSIGHGNSVRDPGEGLLEALTDAYRAAAEGQPTWNGRDFYVSFGEGEERSWDEAMRYGFICAGGGEWYSKTLQQLEPGHRVFAYIPRGRGPGGYVGVGEVTGEPVMAKDFRVQGENGPAPYLDVTFSDWARAHGGGPDAEWMVPIRWISTRTKDDAVKDSDFFANQNSAVKLTHGYTLERLAAAFAVGPPD